MRLVLVILAAAAALVAQPARAALISADLAAPGDGLVTVDTATGFEWLDLTATNGQTFVAVAAGFGGYVTEMGFRPAQLHEVVTFLTNGGMAGGGGSTYAIAAALMSLIGCTIYCETNPVIPYPQAYGLAEPDLDLDPNRASSAFVVLNPYPDVGLPRGQWGASGYGPPKNVVTGGGVWLVRVVPEPGTLLLAGVGLAMLARYGRPRRSATRSS